MLPFAILPFVLTLAASPAPPAEDTHPFSIHDMLGTLTCGSTP
jgi:hypothetical protein